MNAKTQFFTDDAAPTRSWLRGALNGACRKCPDCGVGALFNGYLRVAADCVSCGVDFSGHQADDAPPYLTMFVVGHMAIPLALAAKQLFEPPLWLQFAFWGPAMLIATLWFLPRAKGALIGLQWANRMHGFALEPPKLNQADASSP